MGKHKDEEDDAEYGERKYRSSRIKWSITKVLLTLVIFGGSIALIILGIYPIIEMDLDVKNIANILFVILHIFYCYSFSAVKRTSQFVFWSGSFLLLDIVTFLFYFYEDIFI